MESVRAGAAIVVRLLLGLVRMWAPLIWLLTIVAVVLAVLGQISLPLLGLWILLSVVAVLARSLLLRAAIRLRPERDSERN